MLVLLLTGCSAESTQYVGTYYRESEKPISDVVENQFQNGLVFGEETMVLNADGTGTLCYRYVGCEEGFSISDETKEDLLQCSQKEISWQVKGKEVLLTFSGPDHYKDGVYSKELQMNTRTVPYRLSGGFLVNQNFSETNFMKIK